MSAAHGALQPRGIARALSTRATVREARLYV